MATELDVLRDMFQTLVHVTPGAVVTIAPADEFKEMRGDEYDGPQHETHFRTRDEVVEAFCKTCEGK